MKGSRMLALGSLLAAASACTSPAITNAHSYSKPNIRDFDPSSSSVAPPVCRDTADTRDTTEGPPKLRLALLTRNAYLKALTGAVDGYTFHAPVGALERFGDPVTVNKKGDKPTTFQVKRQSNGSYSVEDGVTLILSPFPYSIPLLCVTEERLGGSVPSPELACVPLKIINVDAEAIDYAPNYSMLVERLKVDK